MAPSKQHRNRSRSGQRRRGKTHPKKTAEVLIESVGARGDGVARYDGQTIYVPYTVTEDRARITYRGERGKMETLLSEGPDRISPPCPHFGVCGGCALQHLNEKAYREWKRQRLVDALLREGFDESIIAPLVVCAPATRRRVQFAVRKTKSTVMLGFNERASARVIDIERCPVLAPELAQVMPALRTLAAATPDDWQGFDLMATVCDNGVDVVLTGGDVREDLFVAAALQLTEACRASGFARLVIDETPLVEFSEPTISFGGVAVALPTGGFLQASREGEAALLDLVTSQVAGAKRVADLFCGAGTFSFPLAVYVNGGAHVDGFDADAPAIAALDAASRRSDLGPMIKAQHRNLFDRPLTAEELKRYDAVVIDPPRAGARAQAEQLAASSAPVVVSVSCNPKSFARDGAILRDGGYVLSQVTPVDQFVYSTHLEMVGVFRKG